MSDQALKDEVVQLRAELAAQKLLNRAVWIGLQILSYNSGHRPPPLSQSELSAIRANCERMSAITADQARKQS